jgi:hypothetical protein
MNVALVPNGIANKYRTTMKKLSQILTDLEQGKISSDHAEKQVLDLFAVSGSFPSDNEIETAALNYRDKSDDENTNEDTMQIEVHWYDKQEAFTAGVKWFIENYR